MLENKFCKADAQNCDYGFTNIIFLKRQKNSL